MFEDESEKGFLNLVKSKTSISFVVRSLVFVVGLLISIFGLFQLYTFGIEASEGESVETIQTCEKEADFGRITVDIGGAVENPGVYELPSGARINDLVEIALGFSSEVDKYHINKVLNLSEKLSDGQKIYIPTQEESLEIIENFGSGSAGSQSSGSANSQSGSQSNSQSGGQTQTTDLISINSASKTELMSLSGIGEVRAQNIISARPYSNLDQLIEFGAVGESLFENIKDLISI